MARAEREKVQLENARRECADRSLLVGGRFLVQRLIGKGGMGVVFEAEEVTTGKRFALKVLRVGSRLDPQISERFVQESLTCALLHHPNIVRAFGAFNDAREGPVLVLELLEGESLDRYLGRCSQLPVERVLRIAIQIAAGLAAAHQRGVVHRDLKPANVFLEHTTNVDEPSVKVLDFGIALLREHSHPKTRDTGENATLGTLEYMAPEQLTDPHGADERADVYSLGMTIYEMLAGKPAFSSRSQAHLWHKILFERAESIAEHRKEVLPDLASVIDCSIHKRPDQRFQTMADFAEALNSAFVAEIA